MQNIKNLLLTVNDITIEFGFYSYGIIVDSDDGSTYIEHHSKNPKFNVWFLELYDSSITASVCESILKPCPEEFYTLLEKCVDSTYKKDREGVIQHLIEYKKNKPFKYLYV